MTVLLQEFIFLVTLVNLVMSYNEMWTEPPIRHPDCPPVDDPLHPVLLPYASSCQKYYSCQNGFGYALTCPNQLQWNVLTYRCDHPTVVKCIDSSGSTVPTSLPAAITNTYPTSATSSNEPFSYQPYAGDCNKFYQCTVMRCAAGQQWNAALQRCDLPSLANCAASGINAGVTMPPTVVAVPTAATAPPNLLTTTPPTTANGIVPTEVGANVSKLNALCSAPGVKYLHYPGDCHKFIQCNGVAFVHTCADDLFWNAELFTCDRYCK